MRRRRRRNRKLLYALQISWIVLAITATIVIITQSSKWFGNGDNAEVNAAGTIDNNGEPNGPTDQDSSGDIHTGTPTPEVTITPTVSPEGSGNQAEGDGTGQVTPSITPGVGDNDETTNQGETTTPVDNDDSSASTSNSDRVIDPDKPMVALTFDDGPYPPVTKRILETLEKNDARATFFVMGNRVDTYGDTLKLVHDAGNQIGNHSYSHKDLTKLDQKGIEHEVDYSNELINEKANVGDAYLRPPYGAKSEKVSQYVKVPMIAWCVDTLDWQSRDKNKVFEEVKRSVSDGAIVLMHDLYPSTADAIELIVPWLVKQGYQVVTVEEMFKAKGIELEPGKIYYNAK
ncbi:polysaccharide deacetylase family protein [Lachnoclostridium phytofermentans]|uniref:Polysaccharide deacetylase n=1 Tax=Lachnoclostridium phytofermentans (strain ATCC 700394 / DSM 18823 / ISDg) TaxID=357809 RepID=A9KR31_LACP7|nr:polysaccharide deacetylase family protein [Lachnoclostridium phytofermentans]ABX40499.1 polysaccharide deacetylase [Lachnoclostridium phytofermentans ISDg]